MEPSARITFVQPRQKRTLEVYFEVAQKRFFFNVVGCIVIDVIFVWRESDLNMNMNPGSNFLYYMRLAEQDNLVVVGAR